MRICHGRQKSNEMCICEKHMEFAFAYGVFTQIERQRVSVVEKEQKRITQKLYHISYSSSSIWMVQRRKRDHIFLLFNWLIFIPLDHDCGGALFLNIEIVYLRYIVANPHDSICLIEQTEMGIHVIYSPMFAAINRAMVLPNEEIVFGSLFFHIDGFIKATHDIIIHARSFFSLCSSYDFSFSVWKAKQLNAVTFLPSTFASVSFFVVDYTNTKFVFRSHIKTKLISSSKLTFGRACNKIFSGQTICLINDGISWKFAITTNSRN